MLITTQEMSIEGTSRKFILSKWLSYIAKLLDGLLHISFGSSTEFIILIQLRCFDIILPKIKVIITI
jgi:hypothetical protein